MSYQENRIFTLNEPNAPRLNPALACEIGLNESLLLLQLEYWISISNNERDGQKWTYQSTRDMKASTFSFWSVMTINRAVKSLEDKKLIITTTKYNKVKYDKTRWFTLNYQELAKLNSIAISGYVTGSNQNDTGSYQNDTGSSQDVTTIPENTSEISSENNNAPVSPSAIEVEPEPPKPYPSDTKLSFYDKKIVKKKIIELVPQKFQVDSVKKIIENALLFHPPEHILSAVQYTNDHATGDIWQRYKAYLQKTIREGYARNYEGEFVDLKPTSAPDFSNTSDATLKALATAGNSYAQQELDRRAKKK